jgi:hypothetical protein
MKINCSVQGSRSRDIQRDRAAACCIGGASDARPTLTSIQIAAKILEEGLASVPSEEFLPNAKRFASSREPAQAGRRAWWKLESAR